MKLSSMTRTGKILVLGGGGMLGRALLRTCSQDGSFDIYTTTRKSLGRDQVVQCSYIEDVDAREYDSWKRAIDSIEPDFIVNCIGIIKQKQCDASDDKKMFLVNAEFPHALNQFCSQRNTHLLQISTDCVFSGTKGNYSEEEMPDAQDSYGKSKHQGEGTGANSITIRTSIVGPERSNGVSLLEWCLRQKGDIPGYSKCYFNGLTTNELSNIIVRYFLKEKRRRKLYHVGGVRISKSNILRLVKDAYRLDYKVIDTFKPDIDRTLNSVRFYEETGYKPKEWVDLIAEMKNFWAEQ